MRLEKLLIGALVIFGLFGCEADASTPPRIRLSLLADGFTSPVVVKVKVM